MFNFGRTSLHVLALALLAAAAAGAHADFVFDRADKASRPGTALVAAMSALDADGFVSAFVQDDGIRLWNRGELSVGVDAVRAGVSARMQGHAAGTLTTKSPRVLIEPTNTWLLFDWTWGADAGTQIARVRADGNGWLAFDVDIDGGTVVSPPPGFDSLRATSRIGGALSALREAAEAFSHGDLGRVPLVEPFRFYDADGEFFVGDDALIRAAFARMPDGITEETMTLYVSHDTRRAVAYQDSEGTRVSIALERGAVWQIAVASLSTPLEALAVSACGLRLGTWGDLRR